MKHTAYNVASRGTPAAALAVFAILAACTSNESTSRRVFVPSGTPLEVEEPAYMSVGEAGRDTLLEFYRIATPFLLPDRQLVVPVAGANSIRVFRANGEFTGSFGRTGEGPGEFRSLSAAWSRGDTIEAFDSRLLRITRFFWDRPPELVSIQPVRGAQGALPGILSDGWSIYGVESGGPSGRDQMVVHRYGRDGTHLGVVARVEGFIRYTYPGGSAPEPLSPRAVFALHGQNVYVAETLTPRIRIFDTAGTLLREITWQPDTSLSPAPAFRIVVDSALAWSQPDRGGSGVAPWLRDAAATRQRLESAPQPQQVSLFWKFLVDEQGFIWVRPFDVLQHAAALGGLALGSGGPGGRWTIFTPEGVQVGSVNMPQELEPFYISSEAVVGIRRDALGVESVRVHALQRR